MATTAERLSEIEATLARIELALQTRMPVEDVRQAIDDIFATHGLVTQLVEVYTTQRDELAALVEIAGRLMANDTTGTEERGEIKELLVQLLELGRKHVDGLYDLERAVSWRRGDDERRKAS